MKTLLITLATAVALMPYIAHPFSAPGHQAIAQAAMQLLDAATKSKVDALLDGEAVEDAAIWLDRVRDNFKFQDPGEEEEAMKFDRLFSDNANWHFCDFIVGSKEYSFRSKYADRSDIVHALEKAITVLEGAKSKMTHLQALRTVIHLTGDVHQPLHCSTGFFDIGDLNHPVLLSDSDVEDIKTTTQDRGGNQLYYTSTQELHALWDLGLTKKIATTVSALASKITPAPDAVPETTGDYHHWPEIWAGDTMKQAEAAYEGITFKSAAFVDDERHPGKQKLEISISLPGGEKAYKQDQLQREQDQLTKAAAHLAQLLSRIKFKN